MYFLKKTFQRFKKIFQRSYGAVPTHQDSACAKCTYDCEFPEPEKPKKGSWKAKLMRK